MADIVYWNFSPSYEDYLVEEKDPLNGKFFPEGMLPRRDESNGYNDDDFLGGGPCPSCRLAIDKETGRLKWCMGGNDTCRLRVRLMLFIPVLLLPITIVFIALSRSHAVGKTYSQHRTFLFHDNATHDGSQYENSPPTIYNDVDPPHEGHEENERYLAVMQTSYVPADARALLLQKQRSKRQVERQSSLSRGQPRTRYDGSPGTVQLDNFLVNRYPKAKGDDAYEMKETHPNYYTSDDSDGGADSSDSMDDRFDYEDDDFVEELSQDGTDEQSQSRKYPITSVEDEDESDGPDNRPQDEFHEGEETGRSASASVEDDDSWIPTGRRHHASEEEMLDFHAFWKDEGSVRSIRETQGKMMLKYMDMSVNPCQDFYQYACGNWAKVNPIPKDKAGYDTFEMLRESLDAVLRELLEDPIPLALQADTDDAATKAKRLFQSCMNYEILERRMEQPLLQLLQELGGWPILSPHWDPEKFDWLLLVAQLRLYNNDILISEWVGPDIKNSDQYVIQFDETSLGLPTRDYFLQPSNAMYLEAYKNYLIKVATLLGASPENATTQAEELIAFETKLAKITSTPDERRNLSELYQKMNVGELKVLVPQINWRRYLSIVLARPVNVSESVVVFALQYIQDLVVLLSKTSPRTISNYLLWRFVRHRVNNLDDRFQEVKQKFYYILFGREQAPSRWKTCVAQVNSNMGMAVGSMFVRKYFDENSKNDTLSMTREIQRSFRELLDRTHWIDVETKQIASEKVDAMLLRIGYPDFILQPELLNERYRDVAIQPDTYFENTLNILQHLTRVEQDRLGSPVNKTLWNTAPAVVNAYYSRNKNQIMFPAGILQPPFYHRHFPRSLNYGGIGVVIGHEITHGFDDKGRLFDKDGNLHRWWKNQAINGFHERAQCLIDQYGRYVVPEVSMQIDGVNTQGENIADNGGIKQAFRAYERWLELNGNADETLPGLNATGKQLFFLNFAQVWCGSMRPEAMKNKLKTAVHSPGKFRVIGTLSNSKDFAEVFSCPAGSPMNPLSKCSVW